MKMIRILLTMLFSVFVVVSPLRAATDIDEVENVHIKDRTQYVSNPDGILSAACVDSLNAIIGRTWAVSTAEPVVVALRDVPERYEPIEFAVALGEKWGVGKADKDNGVIILLLTDRRRMTIAPGRGVEGVLPDVVCNRIIRDDAIPYFRDGDYDAGLLAATRAVCRVLTDPQYAEELRSAQRNDARGSEEEFDIIGLMLGFGAVAGVIMLIVVIYSFVSSKGREDVIRYNRLNGLKNVALFLTFLGLGLPLPAYLLSVWLMKRIRNHARSCPNCGHRMKKLDEVTDNQYLTPAQDKEEQLNSVDYDVWLCPECGEKDVIPYINTSSSFSECPHCHARASHIVGTRTLVSPTTTHKGRGEKIYACKNCGEVSRVPYDIAKLAAPIVIVGPGGGGSGFGGGGGISGGSFGGGSFGGGGATGGW